VILTAAPEESAHDAGYSDGADDYLIKPLELTDLHGGVERWCSAPARSDALAERDRILRTQRGDDAPVRPAPNACEPSAVPALA